jgi:hypothetical protein
VEYVAFSVPGAVNYPAQALPEIYTTDGAMAKQWQSIAYYTDVTWGSIVIPGEMTEYAADSTTNTPSAGWTQLYNNLAYSNTTIETGSQMPYSTDITWAN